MTLFVAFDEILDVFRRICLEIADVCRHICLEMSDVRRLKYAMLFVAFNEICNAFRREIYYFDYFSRGFALKCDAPKERSKRVTNTLQIR